CASVSSVESIASTMPIIVGLYHMVWIIASKYYDFGKSNKLEEWIAVWEQVIQSVFEQIIDNLRGFIYGYVKKLDTYKWNTHSQVVLIGIWRLFCIKAIINVSHYISYLYYAHCCKSTVDTLESDTQGPTDEKTLKSDDSELRELTATDNSNIDERNQSPRSSNDIDNDNIAKGDSELWTLMKPSNNQHESGKNPSRKPVRKTRPVLIVEVSKKLKKYVSKDGKYFNINELIGDPYFLIACYEEIKGKSGNMTKGIDNYTLDGINGKWFIKTAMKLKKGTYKFNPARLVEIPKSNGKTRTLSITSPSDKIVQKAFAVILEAIYEPLFKSSSYGFRPKLGVHDALHTVKLQGAAYSWVIQGVISKCFDSIPHYIIRREINKTIACPNTKAFINKLIAYPYVDKAGNTFKTQIGVPQGTVCSPVIANIVLHLLDQYMEDYATSFYKGKLRKHNPVYINLQYLRKKALDNKDYKLAIKYLVQMRRIPGYVPMDPNFRRLLYIRYVDDFIILVIGSMKECDKIRDDVTDFLLSKCGITLNKDKTTISSTKKHFYFLGAYIVNKDYVVYDKGLKIWKKGHIRSLVKAPISALEDILITNGLLKRNRLGKLFPKGRTNLFTASNYDIISWYNSKVNGILSFYSFASNFPKLSTIIWYLKASCALTLANKYKLKTMAKAFSKFGKNLTDPNTRISFRQPSNFKVTNKYQLGKPINLSNLERTINSSWSSKLTDTSFDMACCICGVTSNIEMHHFRKIANIKANLRFNGYKYSKLISDINRKQVPLCVYHHDLLHAGKLSRWEYSRIVEYKK
ncbi:hypothetical protein, partial (mitochondrion) [Candida oxycetoniae]